MTKHLVLGHNGNLGADILETLDFYHHTVMTPITTRYPHKDFIDLLKYRKPEVIWNTIGGGSVAEAKADFAKLYDLHVNLPLQLSQALPNTLIINFSSAFVASPLDITDVTSIEATPKSLYSFTKQSLEKVCIMAPNRNLRAIRVTNLYGHHKPLSCLPGRIGMSTYSLPINRIVPTPTDILAEKLIKNLDFIRDTKFPILNAAPQGGCTVADWGRMLYPHIQNGKLDMERPQSCEIGSSFEWDEDWKTLWLSFMNRRGNVFKKERK